MIFKCLHIPNLIYLAPTSKKKNIIKCSNLPQLKKEHPVGIRVPAKFIETGVEDTTDYSIYNKNKVEQKVKKLQSLQLDN